MQKSLWEALALKDLPAYSSPTQKMAVAAVEVMAAEVAAEAEVAAATAAEKHLAQSLRQKRKS